MNDSSLSSSSETTDGAAAAAELVQDKAALQEEDGEETSSTSSNHALLVAPPEPNNKSKDKQEKQPFLSLSQHISKTLSCLWGIKHNDDSSVSKLHLLQEHVRPYLSQVDAHIQLTPESTAQLPPFSWNPRFRKQYSVLLWIRAELVDEKNESRKEENENKDETHTTTTTSPNKTTKSPASHRQRILYRFATGDDDSTSIGMSVTLGEWSVNHDDDNNNLLETTITAASLPIQHTMMHLPLLLPANEWCLLGMTHTYPYLKRPQWNISINGVLQGSGELPYPVLEGSAATMTHNTLLHQLAQGGCKVMTMNESEDEEEDQANDTTTTPDKKKKKKMQKSDDQKTASELSAPKKKNYKTKDIQFDICALGMYPDLISCEVQQILFDAGPQLCLQQHGRVVPHVPPVSNDTKGSNLQGGPSVGVSLSSHAQALQVQRHILNNHTAMYFGATQAQVLPSRIVLPMMTQMTGEFGETPKVGLVQPQHNTTATSHSSMALHFSNDCHVVHLLSEYLLHQENDSLDTNPYEESSQQMSLHWMEQGVCASMVLPFFLSCMPFGYAYELQDTLYEQSLKFLFELYSNQAALAAGLIRALADIVQYQGARAHESILQAGLLHVLTSTLRQSLVRAQQLKLLRVNHDFKSYEDFRASVKDEPVHTNVICPSHIPPLIFEACAALIDTCCHGGQDASYHQCNVRATSDLALTALFVLGLDMDLWGKHVAAANCVMGQVASLYQHHGDVLREQIPVQSLLDTLRVRWETLTPQTETLANHFAMLLQAMLVSSLSNRKSISLGEYDVASCLGALSDCALGTIGAHVILTVLVNLHENDDVSQRLGRNLIMGQFPDVIAPMLLSRTVFSGERTMMGGSNEEADPFYLWQYHWRLVLVLFSWTTSIAGPEGEIAAKSAGSLMFASALAGSLKGCLVKDSDRDKRMAPSLFLPPAASAIMANVRSPRGVSGRNDGSRSYVDSLSDRLHAMMPLLPALVVSLVSHPADLNKAVPCDTVDSSSVEVLSELLTAVGLSFRRVFGSLAQAAMVQVRRSHGKSRSNTAMHSTVVKAAKDYISHLLMVAVLLESHIEARQRRDLEKQKDVVVLKAAKPGSSRQRSDSDVSWVEVSSHSDSMAADGTLLDASVNRNVSSEGNELVEKLSQCQMLVMATLTDLVLSAMKLGGGEASTVMWREVVATLQDSILFGALTSLPDERGGGDSSEKESSTIQSSSETESSDAPRAEEDGDVNERNVLCRLVAIVLTKAQKRDYEWELWSAELCAALSRLCNLVEEKELLLKPLGVRTAPQDGFASKNDEAKPFYSSDQVLLLSALIDVMSYGRDMTGWCQLILPSPPAADEDVDDESFEESETDQDDELAFLGRLSGDADTAFGTPASKSASKSGRFVPPESPAAATKVMLPILQPVLRVVLGCVGFVHSEVKILIPQETNAKPDVKFESGSGSDQPSGMSSVLLLQHVTLELKETLTAAIVGLSFPNARDVALNALASMRRASIYRQNAEDETGVTLCYTLFTEVVEEIRVRYDGERRLREQALFDAYEDGNDQLEGSSRIGDRSEAESSRAVERLILGGDLIPSGSHVSHENERRIEEISFTTDSDGHRIETPSTPVRKSGSDDFVLFNDRYGGTSETTVGGDNKAGGGATRLGYSQYQGLGSTLEECGKLTKPTSQEDAPASKAEMLLSLLMPYLDKWDENLARDAAESELVELFDSSLNIETDEDAYNQDGSPSTHLLMGGSETAADAMTTFIELSSLEKQRLDVMVSIHLPSHRYSLIAYAERFCWARFMEITTDGHENSMDNLWERGIADGNRDIRSRLITMPCNPQFKRYIPSYLDHSSAMREDSASDGLSDSGTMEEDRRRSTDEFEIGALTKNLLEAGNIEIVDITKKEELAEDELPEILDPEALALFEESDDDILGDGSLDFPSRDDSEQESLEGTDSGKPGEEETVTTESASVGTTAVEEPSALEERHERVADKSELGSSHQFISASPFSHPPDNSASILSLMHSPSGGLIEEYFDNCLHVKAEGSRKCTMLLSATHLILEYDAESEGLFEGEMLAVQEEAERQRLIEESGGGLEHGSEEKDDHIQEQLERQQREIAAVRPKSIRWNLSELSHVYLRRYRLRDSALEMFFIPSGGSSFGGYGLYSAGTSLFLDFGAGHDGNFRRDDAANSIMRRAPPQAIKQWPDRSRQFLHEQLRRLTMGWVDGRITNFDYLLHLNMLAGRSYNDLCQYPVMPWVLSNYSSEEIPDLTDRANFRDLTKPMGALNPERLEEFIERFDDFTDPTIPPFMYGSHYSTSAGVVLHFLVRMHPFSGLHRQLQGGYFDVADRLFSSVPRTWEMCTGSSAAEVKELIPEFYCQPAFLKNTNKFKLGTSQDGELLGNVTLPPWAKGSPEKFVEVMRNALESDICSEMLPDWIDLIFGRKQQGPEAIKAHNVFFYLTYYGSVDVASIEDESLRVATELQIAHFGQCPMQLFGRNHVRRVQQLRNFRKLSFYQMLSAYSQGAGPASSKEDVKDGHPAEREVSRNRDGSQRLFGDPLFLPFFSSPISHWVHLDAPPPGPHAALIAVRLAGTDRCLAVDARGIFHSFRWAWKPELTPDNGAAQDSFIETRPIDKGFFVAQRELPRFRTVPRLPYIPPKRSGENHAAPPAAAISKTLFAGRSVLLVLSDGDGCGSLSMQLVDPAKGSIKGEAIVPGVHSGRITCIAMDPIGTAAGHGGVGGELAIVGASDGGASLWRFMSSHYLPLRPRVRMAGHGGTKVHAVALSSAIHVCASLSENRCCIFSVGNGSMIRSFPPPQDSLDFPLSEDLKKRTVFADTPALALSVQGFVVAVCKTSVTSVEQPSLNRQVITLHLFSLEGVSLGSKALESWRGVPHKITCTPDGTAITVCSGRGVTIHRLSAITPLEFIDEWHVTETDELDENVPAAWDVDFGPSLMRPVVAAAACSSGTLRLHALPGISPWSERHKKSTMGTAVGQALAKPAKRIKSAVGKGIGFGSKFVGMGKEIGREVQSDVKERGVGGFLAGTLFRKTSK